MDIAGSGSYLYVPMAIGINIEASQLIFFSTFYEDLKIKNLNMGFFLSFLLVFDKLVRIRILEAI
jgi:hypothetical protein